MTMPGPRNVFAEAAPSAVDQEILDRSSVRADSLSGMLIGFVASAQDQLRRKPGSWVSVEMSVLHADRLSRAFVWALQCDRLQSSPTLSEDQQAHVMAATVCWMAAVRDQIESDAMTTGRVSLGHAVRDDRCLESLRLLASRASEFEKRLKAVTS
jgi:hypothetical protein